MKRVIRACRRHAFVLMTLIGTTALVVMFVLLMARFAVLEFGLERRSMLETRAHLVAASAQNWCRLHDDQLVTEPLALPLEGLLPAEMTGVVELRRIASVDDDELVECNLNLQAAGRNLNERLVWPLSRAAESAPTAP